MNCEVVASVDLQLNSLEALMLTNVTGEVEELQFVRTSFTHAADEELVAFVLLGEAEISVVGTYC